MNILYQVGDGARKITGGIWARLRRANGLELVGLLAIGFVILNSLFSINMTVKRKPLLEKIVGANRAVTTNTKTAQASNENPPAQEEGAIALDPALADKVLPQNGVTLPVVWKDLGKQLVATGVIDQQKFEALYSQRGGMTPEMKVMLSDAGNEKITINQENAQFLLNVLWAFGLANKNDILEKGEMSDPQYGGANRFASTGGWTLAQGSPMEHYSKHAFVKLSADQQAMVDRVSSGIYRPCCGNSTHFPDCNHGMAMLGLLELMASQGVSETDMYRAALAVNAYWFPDTYLTLATYFQKQGADWSGLPPQALLSAQYSSGQGYKKILSEIAPVKSSGGGGCGV